MCAGMCACVCVSESFPPLHLQSVDLGGLEHGLPVRGGEVISSSSPSQYSSLRLTHHSNTCSGASITEIPALFPLKQVRYPDIHFLSLKFMHTRCATADKNITKQIGYLWRGWVIFGCGAFTRECHPIIEVDTGLQKLARAHFTFVGWHLFWKDAKEDRKCCGSH